MKVLAAAARKELYKRSWKAACGNCGKELCKNNLKVLAAATRKELRKRSWKVTCGSCCKNCAKGAGKLLAAAAVKTAQKELEKLFLTVLKAGGRITGNIN